MLWGSECCCFLRPFLFGLPPANNFGECSRYTIIMFPLWVLLDYWPFQEPCSCETLRPRRSHDASHLDRKRLRGREIGHHLCSVQVFETELSGWSPDGHSSGCIVTKVPFLSRFPMRSMDCIILLCSSRREENQKIETKKATVSVLGIRLKSLTAKTRKQIVQT